jgi:cytochrome c553
MRGIGLAVVGLCALASPAPAADNVASKTALCASCHGAGGKPGDPTIPIIWGQQADYLAKQLLDYRNGDRDSQIMSSLAESLKKDEIPQAAALFASKPWAGGSAKESAHSAPLPIIATCQACHQQNLLGGLSPEGVAPRLAGQLSAYLVDTMTAYASGERANSALMTTIMKAMSADERKAVADYLSSL